jgi:hypothetical protein
LCWSKVPTRLREPDRLLDGIFVEAPQQFGIAFQLATPEALGNRSV